MSYTAKDFETFARIIKDARMRDYREHLQTPDLCHEGRDAIGDLEKDVVALFAASNPRFDRARFYHAAGGDCGNIHCGDGCAAGG